MFKDINNLFAYNVITVPQMSDKVQARTHKKKRINKKWRKRYGFKEVPWNKFIIKGRNIYCHPKWYYKLQAEIYKMEGFNDMAVYSSK